MIVFAISFSFLAVTTQQQRSGSYPLSWDIGHYFVERVLSPDIIYLVSAHTASRICYP